MVMEKYVSNLRELTFEIGVRSLWSGLSASILRQTTYSTARFGLYNALAQKTKQITGGKLSSTSTIACAGLSGGAAGILGNPTEVSLEHSKDENGN